MSKTLTEGAVFICYSKHRISLGWFKLQKEYDPQFFVRPICSKCRGLLHIGDFVDSHFPYEQEHNRCNECESKE